MIVLALYVCVQCLVINATVLINVSGYDLCHSG